MATPDASLGISVNFPTQQFRNGILFAMQMGQHPNPELRPTFVTKAPPDTRTYFKNTNGTSLQVFNPRLDRDGRPLDPDIEVDTLPDTPIQVDCAVEVEQADADELPVGNFRPTRVTTTLLKEEYAQIKECRELLYNGDRYLYGYEPESDGLFDAAVHMIVWYAVEDT